MLVFVLYEENFKAYLRCKSNSLAPVGWSILIPVKSRDKLSLHFLNYWILFSHETIRAHRELLMIKLYDYKEPKDIGKVNWGQSFIGCNTLNLINTPNAILLCRTISSSHVSEGRTMEGKKKRGRPKMVLLDWMMKGVYIKLKVRIFRGRQRTK